MIRADIKKIRGNPNNPRIIKDEKFKKLVQSIREFPQMLEKRPLICETALDGKYVVLGGNMRLRACADAGITEIPIELADDWSIEQKRQFVVKDNIGYGEWDYSALAAEYEMDELADWGLDIPGLEQQIENLPDDYAEASEQIKTDIKLGDLIEIGSHRLLCGDSAIKEDIEKLMSGKKADCIFTDPPYGVSIGKKNEFLNSFQKAGRNLDSINDDDLSPEELKDKLLPAFQNIKNIVMSESCTLFVSAPQGGELGVMMMMMMKEAGLIPRHILIWKKNQPTFSMGRLDYDYQHEPILLTWGKRHKRPMGGQHRTSVWEIDKPRESKEHPTMKPVEIYINAYMNNSENGDNVFDAYSGSGTMFVAAEQTGRKAFGMEISPSYCQVIINRMVRNFPAIEVRINGKPYSQKQ